MNKIINLLLVIKNILFINILITLSHKIVKKQKNYKRRQKYIKNETNKQLKDLIILVKKYN